MFSYCILPFRKILPLLLASFLGFFFLSAQAGSFTAVGDTAFVRLQGKPFIESLEFSIVNPTRNYRLKIYNGGRNGEYCRISSALSWFNLNDQEILLPNNFNQQVAYLEVPLVLQENNLLEVELRSKPSCGLVIEVEGDNSPPRIVTEALTEGKENVPYLLEVNATDTDSNEVLTWHLEEAPEGMEIDPETGVITWLGL